MMSSLTFQMLLQSHYSGDENNIDQLHVEHLVDDNWQELDLNINTPGFDIFVYAILSCQHMYFRNNAAEYGLVLDSSQGLVTVITDKHRSIQSLHGEFTGKLRKGIANIDMVNSIAARMNLCPVSINLKDIPDKKINVTFEAA
jgi:hypothetical protein